MTNPSWGCVNKELIRQWTAAACSTCFASCLQHRVAHVYPHVTLVSIIQHLCSNVQHLHSIMQHLHSFMYHLCSIMQHFCRIMLHLYPHVATCITQVVSCNIMYQICNSYKIKKALTATNETTSYIQILKKKDQSIPLFTDETTATSGFSERLPKIKKELNTTDKTTSYIQIFKNKQIMSPRFMAETAATSEFFRKEFTK